MITIKKIKFGNGIATNSLLLMMVQVVTTALGLIITKLLSVYFSLKDYGTYSQALLVTTTVTSISILGLTNATNYFYNKTNNEQEQRKYISTIFLIQYIVGILCIVMIIGLRVPISMYFNNNRLQNILIIVAWTPVLTNLINMYQVLFVSIGKAKRIAVRNLLVSAVRLIAVVFSCFITKNIVTVLIVILALDICQILYFALSFRKDKYCIRLRDADLKLTKEILAFSIPMAIYVLTNSLTRDIDKYVVSAFSNTETLAIYTNAARILPFDMLTTSLITVLIPVITRLINQKEFKSAQDVFKLYLRIGYILTWVFVGGAVAIASDLMQFLYDSKYMAGLAVFIVYLFIDMIRFANVTTILSGAGKTKVLMLVSLSALGLNVIFNVISFKYLNIMGPALTTLIITILMTFLLLYFGAKEIKTHIVNLFDFKEMFIIGMEIMFFGFWAHWLSRYLSTLGISRFFVIALSYGGYLVVMFSINARKAIDCLKRLNTYK